MNKFSISIKSLITFALLFSGWIGLFAQQPVFETASCPEVKWTYTLSKTSNYEVGDIITIKFKADVLDTRWHLYSVQPSPEMAYTSTEFYLVEDDSKGIQKVGGMTESVKPVEEPDEIMGGVVRYFKEHTITFTQKVKVTSKSPKMVAEVYGQYCLSPEEGGMCKPLRLPFTWEFTAKEKAAEVEEVAPEETNTDETNGGSGEDGSEDGGGENAEEENAGVEGAEGVANEEAGTENENAEAVELTDVFTVTETPEEEKSPFKALLTLFLVSFGAGILAIFTPCVFPMVPMTVTYFTKQSKTKAEGVRKGLVYGGWIVFIYTVVGLIVSLLFGPQLFYQISTSWVMNLIFFIIFVVFALSFLGMFELQLPSSLVNALDKRADKGGIVGGFFMAATLVVVSFSCTGPIVGGLLIEAVNAGTNSIWTPAVGMLGFGLAFGIPFALLAMFPGLLNSLPKSGGWMNVLKVVLGFLELALAMKFLSNADLVLGTHLLERQIFIAIWIAIFFVLGYYLFGRFSLPHDSKVEKLSVPRALLGTASFAFCMYLVPGLWGANLPVLEGLVPPMNNHIGTRFLGEFPSGGGHGGGNAETVNGEVCSLNDRKYLDIFQEKEAHGLCMFYDMEEAVAFAKKKNKPLFVDFTGHTCANCRKMESEVWIQPEVHKVLTEDYVLVSLYVDDRNKLAEPIITDEGEKLRTLGDKWLNFEVEDYNKFAQPYYVLMDPNEFENGPKTSNLETPRGYTPDVKEYVTFLKNGKKLYDTRHGGE